MSLKLSVHPDTLYDEIKSARELLSKWEVRLRDEPIPGLDSPGSEESTARFLVELCGELQVVANKCTGIAVVLTENTV